MNCFINCVQGAWGEGHYFWGIYSPAGKADYLGMDRDHQTRVFIARFEAKASTKTWHGYPVNHIEGRPPDSVLRIWLDQNTLPAAKISKIVTRKSCKL